MADDANESSTPNYTMGYGDPNTIWMNRRSAATHASLLLPHLKPGMRMLDAGYGPGSISVGLAAAVAPGEFIGVDMEESQMELATEAARKEGLSNTNFQVGDVLKLPFPDNHFDAVHCHGLLMHVPDMMAALAELKRVLKPGGVIGAGDTILDSSFIEPDTDLNGVWAMLSDLVTANGGHPQLGKELRGRFSEAGYVNVESAGTFESFASTTDTPAFKDFLYSTAFAPAMGDSAISLGVATREEIDSWREAIVVWEREPGAFATVAWGETIARKP